MKFDILNRWNGSVQFTAEINCDETAYKGVKVGLAIKWAITNKKDLRDAVLSDADLRGADLSGADLRGAVLRDAVLSDADLRGADLSGADLSGAVLRGAVLSDAVLSDAVLSDAVLRGVPKIKDIHQTVFSAASHPEALNMQNWHTCDTTHCRAGWVVHLAGEGGKALEWALGTPAAAAIIYLASDPQIEKIPDFYATNYAALEDMKRLADQEKARAA